MGVIADWVLLQLREEIEMKILKKSYLYDIIKREIWDSMTVKYKTIMVRKQSAEESLAGTLCSGESPRCS